MPENLWREIIEEVDKNKDGEVIKKSLILLDFTLRIQRYDAKIALILRFNNTILSI
jgi:hypothetical protein